MDYNKESLEINKQSKEQLTKLSTDGVVNHKIVPKTISRALRKTEAYLHMANKMVYANPELTLMGSCAPIEDPACDIICWMGAKLIDNKIMSTTIR
ncbi:hypothetical protein MUK42_32966 [Musa troglodytarum]|uniref:Uncharacterized protein n=1 Tax=Musa troglodytarum TaxID=320322 RepID=A0A9E7I3P5_9LILI|nr:hypothetical protein MUK42_32966 [Musa troglodytarum]